METQRITYDICRCYLLDHSTKLPPDVVLKLSGYLRARDYARLSSCSDLIGYEHHTADTLRVLLQVEAFFKKNSAFSNDDQCTETARRAFYRAEKLCRITNRRLDHYFVHRERLAPDVNMWLSKMESYIAKVLGDFSEFQESIPKLIKVTSGATSHDPRSRSQPHLKVRKRYRGPAGARAYVESVSRYFGMPVPRFTQCAVNRVCVVPKSWKTHRTIACEPDGALPFQLAFDSYCKRRLCRVGIDLSSQTPNQEMSRLGSIDGSFATIDLSMASDTVAYNTVAWLFPRPWFQYLCRFRSTHFQGPFGTGKYAKFSSMGNGATFAIETLVFAAACAAVGASKFVVYGDDIVIPGTLYHDVLRLLRFLGFHPNADKSYHTGSFRESCGTFWFAGALITPFYVRDEFRRKPDLCHLINGMVEISVPGGNLMDKCADLVRDLHLPLGPPSLDTTSNVFIDVQSCYRAKLLRSKNGVLVTKQYVSKTPTTLVTDCRTLFLWYLRYGGSNHSSNGDRISTSVPLMTHKYVRQLVSWHMPARLSSDRIYWWSDVVARENLLPHR